MPRAKRCSLACFTLFWYGTTFNCHPLYGIYPSLISIPSIMDHNSICFPLIFLAPENVEKHVFLLFQKALHCRLCNPWKIGHFFELFQWDLNSTHGIRQLICNITHRKFALILHQNSLREQFQFQFLYMRIYRGVYICMDGRKEDFSMKNFRCCRGRTENNTRRARNTNWMGIPSARRQNTDLWGKISKIFESVKEMMVREMRSKNPLSVLSAGFYFCGAFYNGK